MAALLRRPLVIHEQNSIAGLTTGVGALRAKVLSGFPDVLPHAICAVIRCVLISPHCLTPSNVMVRAKAG